MGKRSSETLSLVALGIALLGLEILSQFGGCGEPTVWVLIEIGCGAAACVCGVLSVVAAWQAKRENPTRWAMPGMLIGIFGGLILVLAGVFNCI